MRFPVRWVTSNGWRFQFRHFLLLISTITFTPAQASNGVDDITLPALGRVASLGDLYDERTDQFRSSVFKADIPSTFIKRTHKPYTLAETAITNTIQQKFTLLKLDASIQASILSGLFSVSGSASYLNEDKTTSNEVLGNLLLKYETDVESLQLFYTDIEDLYKKELLNHNGATHIVSSILWGANVAVSFRDSNSNKETQENISGMLSVEFQKLKGVLDISGSASVDAGQTGSHSISNYSVSVHGDVKLPNEIPTNYEQIKELIAMIPDSIKETNDGKGVPLKYTLTPIARVKELMQIAPKDAEKQFAHQLDESILISCIDIFEEISKIQQVFNDLNFELESFPACVAPTTLNLFKSFKRNFTTSKIRFTADFKETLVAVRSGSMPSSALADLAEGVEDNLSGNTINSQIVNLFGAARIKINLCRVFAHAHTESGTPSPVEYFGSRQQLLNERIQENRKKPLYVLFQKYEHFEKYRDDWNENRNTFLNTLNRIYNKLLVVDCDFDYSYCSNIAKPIIKKFKNGKVVIDDVDSELKNSSHFLKVDPLTIEALGRFAEIGELYDARTDRFLEVSLLPRKYPDNLVSLTADVDNTAPQIKDVSSEDFSDKLEALDVNSKDQQFSILARLFPLKRTAQYLKTWAQDNTTRLRSIVRTVLLNEEKLLLDSKLEAVFQPNVLDRVQATHIVVKRKLGFNSVFTLENRRISSRNFTADTSDSDICNQLKDFIVASQPSKNESVLAPSSAENLLSLAWNFQLRIFSDTQGEDSQPISIHTSAELSDYLTKQFYPQQISQNGGKGQPLAYELYPVQNLASEFGIIGPKIRFNSLSSTTEDLAAYLHLLQQAATANIQIQKAGEEMKRNPDCTTNKDQLVMAAIKDSYRNTLGAFESNFSDVVKAIKHSELEVDSLQHLRTEYETKNYFGHGSQYKELDKLSSYAGKLNMVNRLRNSNSGITYIGRENRDVTFNMIFENGDASRTYVLFYKPEWTFGTEGDAWRRLSHVFFGGSSSSEESASASAGLRRFIVDCDFHPAYCGKLNQSAIYKNSRGLLVPYNSTTIGSGGGDYEDGEDIFSNLTKNSLNMTLQNAIRNYDAQLRIIEQTLECVAIPCLNGGRCTFRNDKRHCECQVDFLGDDCEYPNECVHPGTCRSIGTFSRDAKCRCREGYDPDPHDSRKCKLENENATLIFGSIGSNRGIKQFSLSQQTVTQIQNDSLIFVALDVMYRTNTMFWSDKNGNINTAPIRQGAAKSVVLSDPKSNILSLAVDWVYGHLYFADNKRGAISVANLDGSMRKVLFTIGVDRMRAIVVDPLSGWMYWVDWKANKIERAAMDGSQRQVIANTEPEYPNGLALDMTQNRLYWTTYDRPSSIHSINVDGSDQQLVFQATEPTFSVSQFHSVTTFEDFVYWRDYYTNAVYRTNKCGGGGATKIHAVGIEDNAYYTLQAYHFSKQPEGVNYCENRIGGQCSHLCFRIPSTGNETVATKCACPERRSLSSDQRTCT